MEEEDETAGQETTEFLESLGIEADSLPGLASSHPKNRAQLGKHRDNTRSSTTAELIVLGHLVLKKRCGLSLGLARVSKDFSFLILCTVSSFLCYC